MLKNVMKKAMFLGLGSLSLSRKKVELLVEELIREGEVGMDERVEVIESIMKEAQKIKGENMALIFEAIKQHLHELGLAASEDIGNLRRRLDNLDMAIDEVNDLKQRVDRIEGSFNKDIQEGY